MPTRVSRRGLSLCSSLRVFASLATLKGVNEMGLRILLRLTCLKQYLLPLALVYIS